MDAVTMPTAANTASRMMSSEPIWNENTGGTKKNASEAVESTVAKSAGP